MGKVIGLNLTPVQRRESFAFMNSLRESVEMLKTRDYERFTSVIEKEKRILYKELSNFVGAA